MALVLALLVCLVAVSMSFPAMGQFLEEPQNFNAYQGQLNVTFDCDVNSVTSQLYGTWLVNGECMVVGCQLPVNISVGNVFCPFTLNATVENNGTQLQCLATIAFSCDESVVVNRSNTVGLLIQGLLAAPSNVRATTTDTGITSILWEPPFTLDITDADPDITGYIIYIRTSDGLAVVADNVPGTATNFTFSEDRPCVNGSNYFVSAFNPVGEGSRSEEITACRASTISPDGLSGGEIAGIVIGVFAGVAIVAVIIILVYFKIRKSVSP